MKYIFFVLVALLLPVLSCAQSLESSNNYKYSFYKPSKTVFIKKAKGNYIYNERLKAAYKNPDASALNGYLYALAMDYVYSDGSKQIKEYYENAMYANVSAAGFPAALQYYDFLIRTERYKEALDVNPTICGRKISQCVYYANVAKHLLGNDISKEDCDTAKRFHQMVNITNSICK